MVMEKLKQKVAPQNGKFPAIAALIGGGGLYALYWFYAIMPCDPVEIMGVSLGEDMARITCLTTGSFMIADISIPVIVGSLIAMIAAWTGITTLFEWLVKQ